MGEIERIAAIERMAPLGIAWAYLMHARRRMREEVEYMVDLAEAIETCRRTAFEGGEEVEL